MQYYKRRKKVVNINIISILLFLVMSIGLVGNIEIDYTTPKSTIAFYIINLIILLLTSVIRKICKF